MKNILLSMVVLFTAFNTMLFSQDTEPSPLRFNFVVNGDSLTNQVLSRDYFPQTKFAISTQWGGHSRMLKALKFNMNHAWQPHIGWTDSTVVSPADPADSMKYIWYGSDHYNCRAFHFKPTLYIPESKRGEFVVQSADTTKSIFGFSYIRDTNQLLNNPSRTRYYLYDDSTNYIDSVVLEKVWMDDGYELFSKVADTTTNGTHWTFSINLRRLNSGESGSANDTILTIRLPYRVKINSTSYDFDTIRFSTKPRFSLYDTVRLKYREDRGFALNDTATNQNFFVITNKMLPDNNFITATGRQDITINATFICDPNVTPFNPFVRNSTYPYINNLDIQIKYHGKRDVAINFCRISTPAGYDFLVGKQDSLIQNWYQRHINVVQNGGYDIFGFYGRDEFPEEYFTEQRYKSRLLNYTTVSEGAGGHHMDHYRYYVDPMYVWIGSGHFREFIHTPYFRTSTSADPDIQKYRLYHSDGYIGHRTQDTLHSSYETDMDGGSWWKTFRTNSSPETMDVYFSRTLNESASQLRIEGSTYYRFYDKSDYLYGNKFWWANNFPVGNWAVANSYARMGNARAHTGEETRWLLWSSLCMGGKGLMFDARCDSLYFLNDSVRSTNSTLGFTYNAPQINKYNTLPLDSLVFSDDPAFGGDFIPALDTGSYINNYVNRDSTGKYLGVLKDRIYYGRKSPRIEMYYLHNWIRANDSFLMNLRLVSAFSKGFRIWRHADTARFVDTIMNKYIRLDNRMIIFDLNDTNKTLASDYGIRTRPIGRTLNGEPYYETYDSSFFDITLHRFKDDEDLSSGSFVIAALNRRTDPLIYAFDTLYYESEDQFENGYLYSQEMRFYTPSEFIENSENGGNVINPYPNSNNIIDLFQPPSYWQSYFWRRLGCREITIPMAFKKGIYNNGLISITAKELGVNNYDNLGIWYSEPYYHRIDTIIPIDGAIVSKHLPGQGKMIECKINSVFDNSESPCNICDFINNFNDFSISLVAQPKEGNNCCYNIEFTNHSDCSSGIIPVKLISNNSEQIQLDNLPFDDNNNSKILNTSYDISNAGTFSIGQLCVGESSEPVEFEIVFGSDIEGNFYGCDRKFKFVLNCEQDSIEAENCCDLFTVSGFYHPQPAPPAQRVACCTEIKINNYESNYCIKSISLDRYGTGNYTEFDSTIVEPIFSTVGFQTLTDICNPIASCLPGSNTLFSIERDLIFRGVDGEIICTKKVPIYYCCDIIQGPPGTFKTVQNNDATIPLIDNQIQLEIIPNPNDGFAKLRINSQAVTNGKIKIMSSTGETLKEFHDITVKSNVEEIDLNLSDLSSGAYYLIFETELGVKSIQIIKLK